MDSLLPIRIGTLFRLQAKAYEAAPWGPHPRSQEAAT